MSDPKERRYTLSVDEDELILILMGLMSQEAKLKELLQLPDLGPGGKAMFISQLSANQKLIDNLKGDLKGVK